ncbi:MAG: hypothetical protein H6Q14_774 [Bacteroidetes bacterium]|nr:hypothetical protein [Bacteroidota bacterium]
MKNKAIYQIECRNHVVKLMDDTRELAILRRNLPLSGGECAIEGTEDLKRPENAPDDVWELFVALAAHVENADLTISRINIEFPDYELHRLEVMTDLETLYVAPDDITHTYQTVEAMIKCLTGKEKEMRLISTIKSVPAIRQLKGVPDDVWGLFVASAKKARRKNKKKMSTFAIS